MLNVRTPPVQNRSGTRIEQILDATARVVDEVGYARLTTSLVAEYSGSAIGTVYRYFPDRIGLLVALRDRAVQRFLSLVIKKIKQTPGVQLPDAGVCGVDACVWMFRNERGFQVTRFEVPATDGALSDYERKGFFARQFIRILSEQFDIEDGAEQLMRMEVIVEISLGLITRAFLDENGDGESFIAEARAVAQHYLKQHFFDEEDQSEAALASTAH